MQSQKFGDSSNRLDEGDRIVVVLDSDLDSVVDEFDNCPNDANIDQADADNDNFGDACDPDRDGDKIPNISDCDADDPKVFYDREVDADIDGDGVGSGEPTMLCSGEEPPEGYVFYDEEKKDNCPAAVNTDQANFDSDEFGDACEDSDGDEFLDANDNCPALPNPTQLDSDSDGIGNACEGEIIASNLLYYKSDASDYIGQGQEVTHTDENAEFSAFKTYSSLATDYGYTISIDDPSATFGLFWWDLNLESPGSLLVPGSYYNATRFPFNDDNVPGLNFSGTGRGCNTLTGEFHVYDVEYVGEELKRLHAEFIQHCEGGDSRLVGAIQWVAPQ
jgi:hypothetical protein